MKQKLMIFVMIAAFGVVVLPSQTKAADNRNLSLAGFSASELTLQQGRGRGRGNRRWDNSSRRRNGSWYGYRNYGQYRRTQVGNRRYRYVRRPYYRDGRLYYRLTRIFY